MGDSRVPADNLIHLARAGVRKVRAVASQSRPGALAGVTVSQADALLACDFLETVTLSGARLYSYARTDSTGQPLSQLHSIRLSGGSGLPAGMCGVGGDRLQQARDRSRSLIGVSCQLDSGRP